MGHLAQSACDPCDVMQMLKFDDEDGGFFFFFAPCFVVTAVERAIWSTRVHARRKASWPRNFPIASVYFDQPIDAPGGHIVDGGVLEIGARRRRGNLVAGVVAGLSRGGAAVALVR